MYTSWWRPDPSRYRNLCRGCNNPIRSTSTASTTRWGHLFQGRYKAIVCEKDEYLLTLVRYIHLNPFRAKLVDKLDDYRYSGHHEYCGARASEVVGAGRVLDMLGGRAAYRRFMQEGMKEGHRKEYYDVKDQRFLGEERFVEKLKVQAEEEPETARPSKPVMAV